MISKLSIKWFAFGILLIVVEHFNILNLTSGEILGYWAAFGVLEVINQIEEIKSESFCTKN